MSKKHRSGNKPHTNIGPANNQSVNITRNVNADVRAVDLHALESEAILSGYDLTLQNFEQTSGPLPSPRIMKGYSELDPSLPDRIVTMAEKQLDHEIDMDRRNADMRHEAMEKGFSSAHRGQWIGAFLGLSLIGSSVWLAMNDHEGVSIAMICTGLAVVLGAFVKDHFKKE